MAQNKIAVQLLTVCCLATALLLPLARPVVAEPSLPVILLSAPGPRNISYLPVDLITKIGADREEGFQMQVASTGGGAVALTNLMNRNAEFAVAGLPAAMSLNAKGERTVAIAAVDDRPLFVFMVRRELQGTVQGFADLKGKIIGVNTSSLTSKTTSQQLVELLLASADINPNMVRLLPAGQSWKEQSSLIKSGSVDALMGDEPFASRLLAENKVFFLANLADPAFQSKIAGANFLHATLLTRSELIDQEPEKVAKVVRCLRRTLQWIAAHTPEELVAKLDLQDQDELDSLLACLKKYPNLYSQDGRFSTRQLQESEQFFRASSRDDPAAQGLKVEAMVKDTWAERRE